MRIRILAAALLCGAALGVSGNKAVATPLDDMISPVTHPVVFEDPRHSTELKPLYVYHKLDDKFVTGGGDATIWALQARFKVSDDLSIIAVKDGFVDLNPDGVVPQDTGFANITGGAKYSFFRSEDSILTGGLTYEIPSGQKKVLQGHGDGLFNPFFSYGTTSCNWNFIVGTGLRLPLDNDDSSFYDLNMHVSYKMENFYPLVEFGMVTVLNGGTRLPIADEGEDYFNLGSSESDHETITTMAIGARYRIADNIDAGAAWQFPLERSTGTRIIDYRVTADLIYRFEL
ncbi:MAG: hypothetical protein K1X83_02990 [Oligoflexia bacterium]|nr:hypothetical protein [Oligoflexia bacterium]